MIASLVAACGCTARPAPPRETPAAETSAKNSPAATTITLIIDYGDSAEKRLAEIPWHEKMTVFDVMKAAEKRPHGVVLVYRGSGETAMLTRLDDLENQGGASEAKNWVYRINGKMGQESFGIAEVKPGDTVLWKFGPYE